VLRECEEELHGALDMQDSTTNNHITALVRACRANFPAGAKLLLKAGANVDGKVLGGFTSLYGASQRGVADVASLLLKHGATLDLPIDDGTTPLQIASEYGHIPVVKLLLEHGASVDLANDDGVTPLMLASRNGHAPVVRLLLEHDADPHLTSNQGLNALHLAAFKDHPETCLVLIAHGSDPEALTNAGNSATSHFGQFLDDNDPEDEDEDDPDTRPRLSPADKAERVALLRTARAAYLLQQLRDANWRRRYPFLQTLLSGGLRLSAAQRAEQAQVQAALDTSVAIPPIPRHTKKLNRAYLLRQILSCQCNEGVVRLVASFL
jgi:ankyrin repeat protein